MNSFVAVLRSFNIHSQKLRSLMSLTPFDVATPEGRSRERYRRVMLATLASALAKVVALLAGLVSVPLAVGYLGAERYGLWMTIASVIAIIAFADLGMGNGLMNAIIEANGKDDREAAHRHTSSAFFMLFGIGVAVIALFSTVYAIVPWSKVFNVTSELATKESGPAVAVFVACFACSLPLGVVQRVQMGYQEGLQSNLWQCAGSILGLGGVILGIYLEAGLPWLVLAMAGAPVIVTCFNWIVQFCWSRPWLLPRWKSFEWNASQKIIAAGSVFLLLQVFTLIGNASDGLVLAQIMGPRAVAQYTIAQKLFSIALVAQFFIAPLWPAFGDALERSDYTWVRHALRRALVLSLGIGILAVLPLLVFGKWIVAVWVGPELVPSSGLLAALAGWMLLASYGGVMSVLLNNGKLLRKQAVFYGAASLTALVLKIVLAWTIGIPGVVWATVIGYGIIYIIPAALLARSMLKEGSMRRHDELVSRA
ncbi:MAG: hypothetical protein EPO19_04405 [Betaproteobacteria bacterium]|nr:MAG: hypothetical protein EPO19_04405 [Betaproteobacteria bacterium]